SRTGSGVVSVDRVTVGSADGNVQTFITGDGIGTAQLFLERADQVESIAVRVGEISEIEKTIVTKQNIVGVVRNRGCVWNRAIAKHAVNSTIVRAAEHDVGLGVAGHGVGAAGGFQSIDGCNQIHSGAVNDQSADGSQQNDVSVIAQHDVFTVVRA